MREQTLSKTVFPLPSDSQASQKKGVVGRGSLGGSRLRMRMRMYMRGRGDEECV